MARPPMQVECSPGVFGGPVVVAEPVPGGGQQRVRLPLQDLEARPGGEGQGPFRIVKRFPRPVGVDGGETEQRAHLGSPGACLPGQVQGMSMLVGGFPVVAEPQVNAAQDVADPGLRGPVTDLARQRQRGPCQVERLVRPARVAMHRGQGAQDVRLAEPIAGQQ